MDAQSGDFGKNRPDRDLARPIDLAHEKAFSLAALIIEPSMLTIAGPEEAIKVEPKVMQVLVTLAREPGAIFSRDDLIDLCWDGRIVGDASINRVISLLRSALRDAGATETLIENVPKVGYRLTVEKRVVAAAPIAPATKDQPAGLLNRIFSHGRVLVFALLATITIAVAFFAWKSTSEPADELRIVMLPLEYGDGTDQFFALGLGEQVRSELARYPGVSVIGSSSARQMIDSGETPEGIASRLDGDYLLAGQVSTRAEQTVFVARLIDGETGDVVWSMPLASAPQSANTLPSRVVREMLTKLGHPESVATDGIELSDEDFALYLTAMGLIKSRDEEAMRAAQRILTQLVDSNRDSPHALAGLAKAKYLGPFPNDAARYNFRQDARRLAQQALALDPDNLEALKVAGSLGETDSLRIKPLERATQLDPSDAEAWWWLSIAQETTTDMTGSVESSRRMVLNDPLWVMAPAATDAIAASGRVELAMELEKQIAAAAVYDWQRDWSKARQAKMRGDLSEYLRLLAVAQRGMGSGDRRTTSGAVLAVRTMLGLDSPPDETGDFAEVFRLLKAGRLPPESLWRAAGISNEQYWAERGGFWYASPVLYLGAGRHRDLLERYDAVFSGIEDYKRHFAIGKVANIRAPLVSLYLAEAFDRAGRSREATEHRALVAAAVARWEKSAEPVVMTHLTHATYAALQGDEIKAIGLIETMIDNGWPYTMVSPYWLYSGPLSEDPLWADLRQDPRLQKILAPVKANLLKERAEVLALGL